MDIILIAALAKNNVIGINGQMPWHISEDLERFKKLTLGNVVLMGRGTYNSIGRPLSKKRNIVLSMNKCFMPDGVEVANSLEEALNLCDTTDKLYCIGGGQVYREILPYATHLELTKIHKNYEGDTYFPTILERDWKLINTEFPNDEINQDCYTFLSYEKVFKQ